MRSVGLGMALKDWRKSKTNDLLFFKPGRKGREGTDVAKETLSAVRFGTDYDIYLDNTKIKRVSTEEQALGYMRNFMRTH